jgi:hypothetical protein
MGTTRSPWSDPDPQVDPNEDHEEPVWYASLGSMMNTVGLRVRGVEPSESVPGVILGRRRVFSEPGGMATLGDPETGAECTTVVHRITLRELRILETREPASVEIPVTLLRPNKPPEEVTAYASVMDVTAECKPTERYVDIMVRGAVHAGMRSDLVEALRGTPVVPRKPAEDFLPFPVAAEHGDGRGMRIFQLHELAGHGSNEHYTVFNGRVLLHDSENPRMAAAREGLPDLLASGRFRDGEDITMFCAVQYYEPRYAENGVSGSSVEEMSQEHLAWLEDWCASFILRGFERVGFLETPPPATTATATATTAAAGAAGKL